MSELSRMFAKEEIPDGYIHVEEDANRITFTLQEGPVEEAGCNGCQVDALIWAAAAILRNLNRKLSCRENYCAITHLEEAMMWVEKRMRESLSKGSQS